MNKPNRILGLQQIAIGGPDKQRLRALWVDMHGLAVKGNYVSERENDDEDICAIAAGAHEPWIQVRLDDFLGVMPDWICVAVELRQPSWTTFSSSNWC